MLSVGSRMSSPVETISPEATVEEALRLMRDRDIRHLPVVQDGRLVGLVTQSSARPLIFPSMIAEIKVADAMVHDPLTISPTDDIETAARLFYEHKIGCLPVVDEDGGVVGILAVPDLLATFIEFLGLLTNSVRLDLILAPRREALEEVVSVVRHFGGQILSIGVMPSREGETIYSIRLTPQQIKPIAKKLAAQGHQVVGPPG